MIDDLIALLGTKLDLTAEDIADVFWLTHLQQQSSGQESDIPSGPPVPPDDSISGESSLETVGSLPATNPSPSASPVPSPTNPPAKIGVVPRQSVQSAKASTQGNDHSINIPNAPSIRDPLALMKALRPLIRRVPSGVDVVLDEAATATKIAEEQIWIPVTKPVLEPWLELALVVDESTSMLIWQRTVLELQHLFKHYGAFRDVRLWGLVVDTAQNTKLGKGLHKEQKKSEFYIRPGIGIAAKSRATRNPQELIDPRGRRLILVVTDCVSSVWWENTVLPTLENWANSGPVAILQMLPERLWARTALRQASAVELYGLTPGAANQKLFVVQHSFWEEAATDDTKLVKVPVFSLEPEIAAVWSQMVSGKGSVASAGFMFSSAPIVPIAAEIAQPLSQSLTPEQRVNLFWNAASSMARQLASLLAASPVISLPVIRLIQETLLPKSNQVHVAEVLLGGLFVPKTLATIETQPDDLEYRLVDEQVRPILLRFASVSETVSFLSRYILRRFGKTLDQFIAEWKTLSQSEEQGLEEIRSFAVVAAEVLKRKGRQYSEFIKEVESQYGEGESFKESEPHFLSLFPGEIGEALREKIVEHYAPKQLLDVNQARNLAFEIDTVGKTLNCIYTGYSIQRDPTLDPRQDAYQKRMTAESPYPESKAGQISQADIHNIFPVEVKANSIRSNLPYAELAIDQVIRWLRDGRERNSVPEQAGEYSKQGHDGFEPREVVKGQIARTMFYVYTFYRNWVDAAYFEQQQATLRKWHRAYPPTAAEVERSRKIANSAQGNGNPFVLDPTLIERIYFEEPELLEPQWQTFEFDVAIAVELQTTEVEVATIAAQEETTPFEFEVATVVFQQTRRNRKKPGKAEWQIQRQRQHAWQRVENLGDSVTLEMVEIPGGSFVMGAPEKEPGSSDSERPQHTVTLQPFLMGKYPVTQAQWKAVARLPQVNRELQPDPSRFKGDDRPVEGVSWYDAVEFCDRLARLTGKEYRLPSEAEWEYACRAGTTTPFHFGETITPDVANYRSEEAYRNGPMRKSRGQTTPVGSFRVANAFGPYDMHGNVWEWCADYWHKDYKRAPTDGSAWLSGDKNALRLLRGGSWLNDPGSCRSADRNGINPAVRYYSYGFRVACSLARTL